jgi:hypothetical protein
MRYVENTIDEDTLFCKSIQRTTAKDFYKNIDDFMKEKSKK